MEYGMIIHGSVGTLSEVYFKLILGYNGFITVVCLQDFDEYDYDQSRFVRNSKNEIHIFESETKAVKKLNEWFKQEEIDEKYRDAGISAGIDIIKD